MKNTIKDKTSRTIEIATKLVLFTLFIGVTVIAIVPSLREKARGLFLSEQRSVLSTLTADFTGKGDRYQVVKVKSKAGLFLEIYRKDGDISIPHTKINLQTKNDGYFNFNGQASNLALDDINGDQVLDVIIPNYDSNLVARLSVISYNEKTRQFHLIPND